MTGSKRSNSNKDDSSNKSKKHNGKKGWGNQNQPASKTSSRDDTSSRMVKQGGHQDTLINMTQENAVAIATKGISDTTQQQNVKQGAKSAQKGNKDATRNNQFGWTVVKNRYKKVKGNSINRRPYSRGVL